MRLVPDQIAVPARHRPRQDEVALAALAGRVTRDLALLDLPVRAWTTPVIGPDGAPAYDVVIVGAGLSGLAVAAGLQRRRVGNILVVDRAARGREGPWVTTARMDTLRSPKSLPGLADGIASLTYRAWHEAAYGAASWPELHKIDRHDWMDYLLWYRAVLELPVANETRLLAIEDAGDCLRLGVDGPSGPAVLHARKLVLATGLGVGSPNVPPEIATLPAALWSHCADGRHSALQGRDVAVLGAGASALDACVDALRQQAASVVLYVRGSSFRSVEVLAWSNFPGFLLGFAELPAAERWRFAQRFEDLAPPPTQEMFDIAASDPRFCVCMGTSPHFAAIGDGLEITAAGGTRRHDYLMLATGCSAGLQDFAPLAALYPRIALWRHRYQPPADEADPRLGGYPYLGPGLQLQGRTGAEDAIVRRIHVFNPAALPSAGPICNGVTGLRYGAMRLADALTRDLFAEESAVHLAGLRAYAEPAFDGSAARVAALRAGLVAPAGATGSQARAAADRLIAASARHSAEFGGMLANHQPMQIEALARLGASAERLDQVAGAYAAAHEVPRLGAPLGMLSRGTWREALGQRAGEAALRQFFVGEARRLGGAAVIREFVPQLAWGVAGSAMHPLMRLAYGVLRRDDDEIGHALGYWAATFLRLRDEPDGAAGTDDPMAVAAVMRGMPAFAAVAEPSPLLWHWMARVGGMDAFAPLIGRFRPGPDALDRVAAACAALYAADGSFETLHALTGAHWLRVVAPLIDDPAVLIRAFWQAILALYPKIGLPAPACAATLAALRAGEPACVAGIAHAAVAMDDEHDHSLVFSCLEEFRHRGDPLYLALAARRLGLRR